MANMPLKEKVVRLTAATTAAMAGVLGNALMERPVFANVTSGGKNRAVRTYYCSSHTTWDEMRSKLQPASSCFKDSDCSRGGWCDNQTGQVFSQDEALTVVCRCRSKYSHNPK